MKTLLTQRLLAFIYGDAGIRCIKLSKILKQFYEYANLK